MVAILWSSSEITAGYYKHMPGIITKVTVRRLAPVDPPGQLGKVYTVVGGSPRTCREVCSVMEMNISRNPATKGLLTCVGNINYFFFPLFSDINN